MQIKAENAHVLTDEPNQAMPLALAHHMLTLPEVATKTRRVRTCSCKGVVNANLQTLFARAAILTMLIIILVSNPWPMSSQGHPRHLAAAVAFQLLTQLAVVAVARISGRRAFLRKLSKLSRVMRPAHVNIS